MSTALFNSNMFTNSSYGYSLVSINQQFAVPSLSYYILNNTELCDDNLNKARSTKSIYDDFSNENVIRTDFIVDWNAIYILTSSKLVIYSQSNPSCKLVIENKYDSNGNEHVLFSGLPQETCLFSLISHYVPSLKLYNDHNNGKRLLWFHSKYVEEYVISFNNNEFRFDFIAENFLSWTWGPIACVKVWPKTNRVYILTYSGELLEYASIIINKLTLSLHYKFDKLNDNEKVSYLKLSLDDSITSTLKKVFNKITKQSSCFYSTGVVQKLASLDFSSSNVFNKAGFSFGGASNANEDERHTNVRHSPLGFDLSFCDKQKILYVLYRGNRLLAYKIMVYSFENKWVSGQFCLSSNNNRAKLISCSSVESLITKCKEYESSLMSNKLYNNKVIAAYRTERFIDFDKFNKFSIHAIHVYNNSLFIFLSEGSIVQLSLAKYDPLLYQTYQDNSKANGLFKNLVNGLANQLVSTPNSHVSNNTMTYTNIRIPYMNGLIINLMFSPIEMLSSDGADGPFTDTITEVKYDQTSDCVVYFSTSNDFTKMNRYFLASLDCSNSMMYFCYSVASASNQNQLSATYLTCSPLISTEQAEIYFSGHSDKNDLYDLIVNHINLNYMAQHKPQLASNTLDCRDNTCSADNNYRLTKDNIRILFLSNNSLVNTNIIIRPIYKILVSGLTDWTNSILKSLLSSGTNGITFDRIDKLYHRFSSLQQLSGSRYNDLLEWAKQSESTEFTNNNSNSVLELNILEPFLLYHVCLNTIPTTTSSLLSVLFNRLYTRNTDSVNLIVQVLITFQQLYNLMQRGPLIITCITSMFESLIKSFTKYPIFIPYISLFNEDMSSLPLAQFTSNSPNDKLIYLFKYSESDLRGIIQVLSVLNTMTNYILDEYKSLLSIEHRNSQCNMIFKQFDDLFNNINRALTIFNYFLILRTSLMNAVRDFGTLVKLPNELCNDFLRRPIYLMHQEYNFSKWFSPAMLNILSARLIHQNCSYLYENINSKDSMLSSNVTFSSIDEIPPAYSLALLSAFEPLDCLIDYLNEQVENRKEILVMKLAASDNQFMSNLRANVCLVQFWDEWKTQVAEKDLENLLPLPDKFDGMSSLKLLSQIHDSSINRSTLNQSSLFVAQSNPFSSSNSTINSHKTSGKTFQSEIVERVQEALSAVIKIVQQKSDCRDLVFRTFIKKLLILQFYDAVKVSLLAWHELSLLFTEQDSTDKFDDSTITMHLPSNIIDFLNDYLNGALKITRVTENIIGSTNLQEILRLFSMLETYKKPMLYSQDILLCSNYSMSLNNFVLTSINLSRAYQQSLSNYVINWAVEKYISKELTVDLTKVFELNQVIFWAENCKKIVSIKDQHMHYSLWKSLRRLNYPLEKLKTYVLNNFIDESDCSLASLCSRVKSVSSNDQDIVSVIRLVRNSSNSDMLMNSHQPPNANIESADSNYVEQLYVLLGTNFNSPSIYDKLLISIEACLLLIVDESLLTKSQGSKTLMLMTDLTGQANVNNTVNSTVGMFSLAKSLGQSSSLLTRSNNDSNTLSTNMLTNNQRNDDIKILHRTSDRLYIQSSLENEEALLAKLGNKYELSMVATEPISSSAAINSLANTKSLNESADRYFWSNMLTLILCRCSLANDIFDLIEHSSSVLRSRIIFLKLIKYLRGTSSSSDHLVLDDSESSEYADCMMVIDLLCTTLFSQLTSLESTLESYAAKCGRLSSMRPMCCLSLVLYSTLLQPTYRARVCHMFLSSYPMSNHHDPDSLLLFEHLAYFISANFSYSRSLGKLDFCYINALSTKILRIEQLYIRQYGLTSTRFDISLSIVLLTLLACYRKTSVNYNKQDLKLALKQYYDNSSMSLKRHTRLLEILPINDVMSLSYGVSNVVADNSLDESFMNFILLLLFNSFFDGYSSSSFLLDQSNNCDASMNIINDNNRLISELRLLYKCLVGLLLVYSYKFNVDISLAVSSFTLFPCNELDLSKLKFIIYEFGLTKLQFEMIILKYTSILSLYVSESVSRNLIGYDKLNKSNYLFNTSLASTDAKLKAVDMAIQNMNMYLSEYLMKYCQVNAKRSSTSLKSLMNTSLLSSTLIDKISTVIASPMNSDIPRDLLVSNFVRLENSTSFYFSTIDELYSAKLMNNVNVMTLDKLKDYNVYYGKLILDVCQLIKSTYLSVDLFNNTLNDDACQQTIKTITQQLLPNIKCYLDILYSI